MGAHHLGVGEGRAHARGRWRGTADPRRRPAAPGRSGRRRCGVRCARVRHSRRSLARAPRRRRRGLPPAGVRSAQGRPPISIPPLVPVPSTAMRRLALAAILLVCPPALGRSPPAAAASAAATMGSATPHRGAPPIRSSRPPRRCPTRPRPGPQAPRIDDQSAELEAIRAAERAAHVQEAPGLESRAAEAAGALGARPRRSAQPGRGGAGPRGPAARPTATPAASRSSRSWTTTSSRLQRRVRHPHGRQRGGGRLHPLLPVAAGPAALREVAGALPPLHRPLPPDPARGGAARGHRLPRHDRERLRQLRPQPGQGGRPVAVHRPHRQALRPAPGLLGGRAARSGEERPRRRPLPQGAARCRPATGGWPGPATTPAPARCCAPRPRATRTSGRWPR